MRKTNIAVVTLGLFAATAGVAVGCQSRGSNCEDNLTCQGSGGSSTSTSTSSGMGGGGADPGCMGDPTIEPAVVQYKCGVFVVAGSSPGGDGTKEKPFATFGEAAASGRSRIFACASDTQETDTVVFDGGIEIFAGFTDCTAAGWKSWDATKKAKLIGVADKISLKIPNNGATTIRNLDVVAVDAVAPGASSIALVVQGGSLLMDTGNIQAGNGADGADGMHPADDPMLDGVNGDKGFDVCAAGATSPGAAGKTKDCGGAELSVGGTGGDGGPTDGSPAGNATDGTPPDIAQPTKGKGGRGEGQAGLMSCESGTDGADGAPGSSGDGATGIGTVTVDGFSGAKGADGGKGKPGQAGGGGGGAKGGMSISCMGGPAIPRVGASGASGGTGGCGGLPGTGGGFGGSSIALIGLNNVAFTLNAITLVSGKGGDGGQGGEGQAGGFPGTGGSFSVGAGAAKPGCKGGGGGLGGLGGAAGGGTGGHSLCFALNGATQPKMGVTCVPDPLKLGAGGPGGVGSMAPNGGKGANGVSDVCFDFGQNMACL